MRVYVRIVNFTTKPRFQSADFDEERHRDTKNGLVKTTRRWQSFEKNFVLTRLGGEFKVNDVIMHNHASCICPLNSLFSKVVLE